MAYTFLQDRECENYRTRYVCLCKLVQRLDDILNVYLLILFMSSVPMVILLLYTIGDNSTFQGDIISAIMGLNALLLSVILIISITNGANAVTDAVGHFWCLQDNYVIYGPLFRNPKFAHTLAHFIGVCVCDLPASFAVGQNLLRLFTS